MESNLTCGTLQCSLPAAFFALQSNNKVRACTNHLSEMIGKGLTPLSIEGFNLVSTPKDVGEFIERVRQRDWGRGNLAMLATVCDQELREASELLECAEAKTHMLVKAAYNEGLRRVRERWQQIKNELSCMLTHISDFPKQREVQLTPTELLLLQESVPVPKFLSVTVSDVAYQVGDVVLKGFRYSTQSAEAVLQCLDSQQRPRILRKIIAESEHNAKEGNFEVAVNDMKYALALGFKDSEQLTKLEMQLTLSTLAKEHKLLLELWSSCEESEIQRVISDHVSAAEKPPQSRDKWLSALTLLKLFYPQGGLIAYVYFKLGTLHGSKLY